MLVAESFGAMGDNRGYRHRLMGWQSRGQPRLTPCGSFSVERCSFEVIAEDDLSILFEESSSLALMPRIAGALGWFGVVQRHPLEARLVRRRHTLPEGHKGFRSRFFYLSCNSLSRLIEKSR